MLKITTPLSGGEEEQLFSYINSQLHILRVPHLEIQGHQGHLYLTFIMSPRTWGRIEAKRTNVVIPKSNN